MLSNGTRSRGRAYAMTTRAAASSRMATSQAAVMTRSVRRNRGLWAQSYLPGPGRVLGHEPDRDVEEQRRSGRQRAHGPEPDQAGKVTLSRQ
jgi:hypothetical protein